MSKKDVLTSPYFLKGRTNPYIHLSSLSRNRTDYFFFLIDHDGIKNDIYARIYMKNKRWYIWYEKDNCRFPVKSFSVALNILEREVEECVG
jgi:hypothetical protein